MKLKSLLPVVAAALASLYAGDAVAVPAYPGVVKMTNPDGSTVDVRIHGDEFFSYYTDADNNIILAQDSKGFWRQRVFQGMPLTVAGGGVDILYRNRPEAIHQPVNNVVADAGRLEGGQKRLSVNQSDGRCGFPSINPDMKGIVVLIEYADKEFSIPNARDSFEKLCNEKGYSEYGHNGSVKDYFTANSHGQFVPTFDVVGPYKVSKNYGWYTGDGTDDKYTRWGYALEEVMKLADADVDFSKYDLDNDGAIDFVYFIYAGYGQADSSDKKAIWPHRGNFRNYGYTLGLKPLTVDGKSFDNYACSNELIGTPPKGMSQPCIGGIGTICHEFSHVIGLPDTYDTNGGKTVNPEEMDIMAGGNYMNDSRTPVMYNAYERYFCRWMELTKVEPGKEYSFNTPDHDGEFSALRIPLYRTGTDMEVSEFFVVEARRKSGWDSYFPEEGILVWRVKYSYDAWVNNNVNINNNPRFGLVESGVRTHVWPGSSNITYVTPDSTYPIVPTFSSDTEVWLSGIKFDKENGTASLGYNVVTEYPDLTTVLKPAARWEGYNVYELRWDEVPEATGYLVKIYDGSSDNPEPLKEIYVTENHYYSEEIASFIWRTAKYRATVTVVKVIPSQHESNVIEFKLSALPSVTPPPGGGVDDVDSEDESLIYGGVGCVVAPENAEVYTLSGVRLANENLAAGMYVVKCGSKAVKVVVR